MNLFGIKSPDDGTTPGYIWWIAGSKNESWSAFFQYPGKDGNLKAHRTPLAEAIKAYEAIGYRCIALQVKENP